MIKAIKESFERTKNQKKEEAEKWSGELLSKLIKKV